MITLNEYIELLKEFQEQGFGELPIAYARDDEGNGFHLVSNEPSLYTFEDLEDYFLEKNEDDAAEPNCIIIN